MMSSFPGAWQAATRLTPGGGPVSKSDMPQLPPSLQLPPHMAFDQAQHRDTPQVLSCWHSVYMMLGLTWQADKIVSAQHTQAFSPSKTNPENQGMMFQLVAPTDAVQAILYTYHRSASCRPSVMSRRRRAPPTSARRPWRTAAAAAPMPLRLTSRRCAPSYWGCVGCGFSEGSEHASWGCL